MSVVAAEEGTGELMSGRAVKPHKLVGHTEEWEAIVVFDRDNRKMYFNLDSMCDGEADVIDAATTCAFDNDGTAYRCRVRGEIVTAMPLVSWNRRDRCQHQR